MRAQALWHTAAGRTELRDEDIAAPETGDVLVRARFGAISRGTEALVFAGRVPASEYERMRGPHMGGQFPFPVKYGYAVVGQVENTDRSVFALHPHQTRFTLPATALVDIPARVPPARAVLAANMETALNAVWDGAPGPADRIAIVGGGVVGFLVARLCAKIPGTEVTVVDIVPERADLARALAVRSATPDFAPIDCDLVIHASASAAGLACALACAGDEATVLELSWYGRGDVAAPLGQSFHSRRLKLV